MTRFKLVTVGRLVPWKQIDRLIDAIAECEGWVWSSLAMGPSGTGSSRMARDRHGPSGFILPGKEAKKRRFL